MRLLTNTFLIVFLGGFLFTCNSSRDGSGDPNAMPDENRFTKEVLDFNLNEPMELAELPGKGILFVERRGALKFHNWATSMTNKIAQLDVFYDNEDGLLGIAVDPNYNDNNWIYLFYSDPGDDPIQKVSRFDLVNEELIMDSEKVLLTVPVIRKCCHSGGSLEFGPNGNLFIGIGDNTNPFESSGYAPIDEREGRKLWDAQRSAGNTNDLRGKILRIKPEADGTYSIPEGNLFPEGTPNTRPEIYVMGCRNPFRFSIDDKTNFVYWGDVGPDAGEDEPNRGPAGMGEFDQAREAGFYGWPYTRGNNQAYNDYDFSAEASGDKFVPTKIVNNSPNNTGMKELPPVNQSMIWYGYDKSKEFPWLGKGGVNPMAGPVFHADKYSEDIPTYPAYFDKKLFVYEWMRDWIYVVTLNENYEYEKAEAFMPDTEFSHPMDMLFGSDGHLYILEYGQSWNTQNMDARLDRVIYNPGNRAPVARMEVDKTVGAVPLTVAFSAEKSKDFDQDELTYSWAFPDSETKVSGVNTNFTFEKPGNYIVTLTVTDPKGESATTTQKIMAGNTPPELTIELDTDNRFYWKGKKVNYKVKVNDQEDGSSEEEAIDPEKIKITFSYLPEGEDIVMATIGHQQNTVPEGQKLIDGSDCKACHAKEKKVNGPSYTDIALKYSKEDKNYLINRIIKGGSGVWGETMMAAHPQLSVPEVDKIVMYILSLDPDEAREGDIMPMSGSFTFDKHTAEEGGKYILMASYLDNGNPEVEESTLAVRKEFIFVPRKIEAENATEIGGDVRKWDRDDGAVLGNISNGDFIRFSDVSFAKLKELRLLASLNPGYQYKGTIEIRENSVDGELIGQKDVSYFKDEGRDEELYTIPISPKSEFGELYIVFKNLDNPKQYVLNADWIYLDYQR